MHAPPTENEPLQGKPRLASGVELIGEYRDSGLDEAPYLARRADGQVVQLSRLLFLVAAFADGERTSEEVAREVGREFGRTVSAQNVEFLVEKKLLPLGVVALSDEPVKAPRLDAALLGLRYRLGVVSAGAVGRLVGPLVALFRPWVMAAVLLALVALDVWLIFFHGLLAGVSELLYQPSLVLAFVAVEFLAMAWHEAGHAAACRYGGAKPGVVGLGIYVIWFVFYSDVTDSYRLSRAGRLRTDCGGLYFDAIFTLALFGAYFATGFEPLLVVALFNQINALDELSPFLRLDGYYIVSDLAGVPDPFRLVKPTLLSLVPGRETPEVVKAMKLRTRVIMTAWTLAVVPGLLVGLVVLVFWGPWFLATAWDSLLVQLAELAQSFRAGETAGTVLGLLDVAFLLVPVLGGALILSLALRRLARWALRRSRAGEPAAPGL